MSTIHKNDMRQRMEGRSITTLGEYIEQKSDKPDPKKLTFDEWFLKKYGVHPPWDDTRVEFTVNALKMAWDAGQANK